MKRLKLGAKQAPTVKFEWRWHSSTFCIRRVWRTDWFSDEFELLDEKEFDEFEKWAKRFSFLVMEVEDE